MPNYAQQFQDGLSVILYTTSDNHTYAVKNVTKTNSFSNPRVFQDLILKDMHVDHPSLMTVQHGSFAVNNWIKSELSCMSVAFVRCTTH